MRMGMGMRRRRVANFRAHDFTNINAQWLKAVGDGGGGGGE